MFKGMMYTAGRKESYVGIILAIVLIMVGFSLAAQSDSLDFQVEVPTIVPVDSLAALPPDSNVVSVPDSVVTRDAINASIFYDALDSMVFDAASNSVLLYGNAIVKDCLQ